MKQFAVIETKVKTEWKQDVTVASYETVDHYINKLNS